MNENKQNRNQVSLEGRVNGTHEYVNLYLHPRNYDRIGYFIKALIISTIVFNSKNKRSDERMVNILNNRLEYPLTIEEQDYAHNLLVRDIREGHL